MLTVFSLNHCLLTVNRIISKSVCLDTRLRDTSLKRCGVKSQFTNSVSCVSIIGVDASLTTTTHASTSRRNIAYILSIDINGGVTFMNDCNLMYLMVKSTVEN